MTLRYNPRPLLDDELDKLLDGTGNARVLVVIDACFSGGFSKDVISVKGRMGMFSSEEDVTSEVAAKFKSGGYLSTFIRDGLRDPLADKDEDGRITALEISQYVHTRYRHDVKSKGIIYESDQAGG